MPIVNYVLPNGNKVALDIEEGRSIMEGAVINGVDGIVGECGGVCSCGTCHAYIDEKWQGVVGYADGDEADMIDFLESKRSGSRLTCQIKVSDAINGIIVNIPSVQE